MKKTIIERKAENQAIIFVLESIEQKIESIKKYDMHHATDDEPLCDWQQESNKFNELLIDALNSIADKL